MGYKLKDYTNTGEFRIIDAWNHQYVETLPYKEAFEKYGECDVDSSYTAGSSNLQNASGTRPSWQTDIWVDIPGMKIGYWNRTNLHLRFVGNADEATFIGKKSGQLITVHEYGPDDYSVWWRDQSEADVDTAGCSVRGTAEQIVAELKGEI